MRSRAPRASRSCSPNATSPRKMTLRRGFSVQPGQIAVVIEDVVTTGGSTREVIEVLQGSGAKVVGGRLDHRPQRRRADLGVPRVALATLQVKSLGAAKNCPLCREGVPVRETRLAAGVSCAWHAAHSHHRQPTTAPIITAGRCSPICRPFKARSKPSLAKSRSAPVHVRRLGPHRCRGARAGAGGRVLSGQSDSRRQSAHAR